MSQHHEDIDDVDRLFAQLERAAVPDDLTSRVLAKTVARPRHRTVLVWPWLLAGIAAMAALSLAGYMLGANLASGDGLDVLLALLGDAGLVTTAPGDVFAALGEVMPWRLLAVAGVSAALMVWAAGRAVSPARQHQPA
jgi:hypothetical protein